MSTVRPFKQTNKKKETHRLDRYMYISSGTKRDMDHSSGARPSHEREDMITETNVTVHSTVSKTLQGAVSWEYHTCE